MNYFISILISHLSIARFGVYELASACDALSAHIRKVLQV